MPAITALTFRARRRSGARSRPRRPQLAGVCGTLGRGLQEPPRRRARSPGSTTACWPTSGSPAATCATPMPSRCGSDPTDVLAGARRAPPRPQAAGRALSRSRVMPGGAHRRPRPLSARRSAGALPDLNCLQPLWPILPIGRVRTAMSPLASGSCARRPPGGRIHFGSVRRPTLPNDERPVRVMARRSLTTPIGTPSRVDRQRSTLPSIGAVAVHVGRRDEEIGRDRQSRAHLRRACASASFSNGRRSPQTATIVRLAAGGSFAVEVALRARHRLVHDVDPIVGVVAPIARRARPPTIGLKIDVLVGVQPHQHARGPQRATAPIAAAAAAASARCRLEPAERGIEADARRAPRAAARRTGNAACR